MEVALFEITVIDKAEGKPLTKHVRLDPASGQLVNDNSACKLVRGSAKRLQLHRITELRDWIAACATGQALALGRLSDEQPDTVAVVTKAKLNGAGPGTIARTQEYIRFRTGAPGFGLIDYDAKGIPPAIAERITAAGGVWAVLVSLVPALAKVARISRASTSTGLYRSDTGERFLGSGGEHHYLVLHDGADGERFLDTLHRRCWLAGYGWYIIGSAGQLLERSIVDRMVGRAERLVFEGPPRLDPPLAQDQTRRQPEAVKGNALDTRNACPSLTVSEHAQLARLQTAEKTRLHPEAEAVRQAWIAEQATILALKTKIDLATAKKIVESQTRGMLLPGIVLPWDDPELAGCTVGDVLADPERFLEATLADPLGGVVADKAKLLRRPDGGLIIHSFAHGGAIYRLLYDYAAAVAAVSGASTEDAAAMFVRCVMQGALDRAEQERLRNLTATTHEIGKRTLDAMLKEAQTADRAARVAAMRERRITEAAADRVVLDRPTDDAEWLPLMDKIGEVLGDMPEAVPPERDIEHGVVLVELRRLESLHLLTSEEGNDNADA
jgi:hypothetical protein